MSCVLSITLRAGVVATFWWLAAGHPTASAAVDISTSVPAKNSLSIQLLVDVLAGGSDPLTSLQGFDNGTLTLFFDPDVFEFPPLGGLQLSATLPLPAFAQPSLGRPANAPAFMALAIGYLSPLSESNPPGVIASGELTVKAGAPPGPTTLTFQFDFNGGDVDFDPEDNPLARTLTVSRNIVFAIPEAAVSVFSLAGLLGAGCMFYRRRSDHCSSRQVR